MLRIRVLEHFQKPLVRPEHEICPSTDRDRLIDVQLFTDRSGHYMRNLPPLLNCCPETASLLPQLQYSRDLRHPTMAYSISSHDGDVHHTPQILWGKRRYCDRLVQGCHSCISSSSRMERSQKCSCSSRNRERCPNEPFVMFSWASHGRRSLYLSYEGMH